MLLSALAAVLLLALAAVQLRAAARALTTEGPDDAQPSGSSIPSEPVLTQPTWAGPAAWLTVDDDRQV
jgi:hypothetical protein